MTYCSIYYLFFLNKLIHQSNPGPHLYLCMHLLLQVAPQELRRHKQPNAIDKRRHSFTTIAVIPSAGNPPEKNVHKRTKKKKPSCCDFPLFLRKAAIHDVPSRVPCSSSVNWLETVHVLVLLKVWQCSFYLSTAHILQSTACPPPLTPPVWYTPFVFFFCTCSLRLGSRDFIRFLIPQLSKHIPPCSNSCTVKLEAPQVSTPSLRENHVRTRRSKHSGEQGCSQVYFC